MERVCRAETGHTTRETQEREGLIKTGGSNRVKGKIWGKNKGGNLVSKCHIFVHKWLCVNSFSMQVL